LKGHPTSGKEGSSYWLGQTRTMFRGTGPDLLRQRRKDQQKKSGHWTKKGANFSSKTVEKKLRQISADRSARREGRAGRLKKKENRPREKKAGRKQKGRRTEN